MTVPDNTIDRRVGKLETNFELQRQQIADIKEDVGGVSRNLGSFRDEWSKKADEDRSAHRAARLTPPQIAGMIGSSVLVTTAILGGIMYLINSQIGSARLDLASQVAQVGLTVRGQVDGLTATQTALQTMQRQMADSQVQIGLVRQTTETNTAFLKDVQSYDAQMARLDERIKANKEVMRRIIDRRPQSP